MDRLSSKGSMIDQLELSNAPRSGFDRSFHNYLSGKLGKIIPTRVEEVLPGDRIKGSSHIVANFEPLVGPILANMVLKQESFYVPQSILWKSSHNFFTGKKGFNNNILSVSHKDMFNAIDKQTITINHVRHIYKLLNFSKFMDTLYECFNLFFDYVEDDFDNASLYELTLSQWQNYFVIPLKNAVLDCLSGADNINSFAEHFKVVDLLKPYIDHVKSFRASAVGEVDSPWIGDPSYSLTEQIEYLIQFWTECFDFWLGSSSQADYLGFGIYNMKKRISNWFSNVRWSYNDTDAGSVIIPEMSDYFSSIPLNWIPVRAAYSVWYWNYRDQLLESDALDAEEFMEHDDILPAEIPLLLLVRVRCWFKDTFTTALTNTGDGNIVIPSIAAAYSDAQQALEIGLTTQDLSNTTDAAGAHGTGADVRTLAIGGVQYVVPSQYLMHDSSMESQEVETEYYVSLEMFDRARRLSSWVAKRLTLGVEYDDVIYSSFMVKLSHVRMRVPELLDTGRSTVAINTIVNNTTIPDAQVAGDKAAIAWAENKSDGVNYFAEEHGYLLSFMTILPIQSYAGGIQRMYLRQNRFDFAWPEFSQIGMDAIYNAELATPQGGTQLDSAALQVFGYQGRYYDYKSKLDEEHGRMRSDLNWMTFSRDFSLEYNAENAPKLNYIFAHCWPSLDMFVTDDPNVDIIRAIDVEHNYHWERVLPVPSQILK